jgi:hypothetical protein
MAGNQIKTLTGSDAAGNISSSLIKEGAKAATGSGIGYTVGLGIKPTKAKVSKKVGGSFATLGGSILGQNTMQNVKLDQLNSGIGITATAPSFSDPTPMQQKMANLRAMRGKARSV